jgi:flagellar hook-associated protein 2
MATFNASGLGSGLDINSLVSQLVAAERAAPNARLNRNEARANTQLNALKSFQTAANALQTAAEALKTAAGKTVFKAQLATDAPFRATVGSEAQPGRYEVEVMNLARTDKLATAQMAPDAALGGGTLSIAVGDRLIEVEIGAQASTLADIRDAINAAAANEGVRATLVNGNGGTQLVLSGVETGAGQSITVAADGAGLQALAWDGNTGGMSRLQVASDALLSIDGIAVSSGSNRFENLVDGVSLDLDRAVPGSSFSLSISRDGAALATALDNFVKAYNNTTGMVSTLGRYDAATDTSAPLQGDAALRGFGASLRTAAGAAYGEGELRTLSQLGVTLQADGKLAFDRAKFLELESSQPAQVASLLGGEQGLAASVTRLTQGYAGSEGVIDSRKESLESRLKRVANDRVALDRRLEVIEARLRRQFNALDTLVSQLQSNASFLTQQLASLGNGTNR